MEEEKKNKILAEAKLRSETNPGFRDLKPGISRKDANKICRLKNIHYVKCYGIDNISFRGNFDYNGIYQ